MVPARGDGGLGQDGQMEKGGNSPLLIYWNIKGFLPYFLRPLGPDSVREGILFSLP